jgi:hypothetical protein
MDGEMVWLLTAGGFDVWRCVTGQSSELNGRLSPFPRRGRQPTREDVGGSASSRPTFALGVCYA